MRQVMSDDDSLATKRFDIVAGNRDMHSFDIYLLRFQVLANLRRATARQCLELSRQRSTP